MAALRKRRRHPPKLRSAFGRPKARRAGFGRSRGCGRGSFRLQKSTSGARPSRPQVKSLRTRRRSSFSVRKHRQSERAPEADSAVAKSRVQWRAPSGALVGGRRSGLPISFSLTSGRKQQPWCFAAFGHRIQRNMTWNVRGQFTQPCSRLITPRPGSIARCGARFSLFKVDLCVTCPKLDCGVNRLSTRNRTTARRSGIALRL